MWGVEYRHFLLTKPVAVNTGWRYRAAGDGFKVTAKRKITRVLCLQIYTVSWPGIAELRRWTGRGGTDVVQGRDVRGRGGKGRGSVKEWDDQEKGEVEGSRKRSRDKEEWQGEKQWRSMLM